MVLTLPNLRMSRFASRLASRLAVCASVVAVLAMPIVASADDAKIPRTPAPEGARVYIIQPTDGAILQNPVVVRFGLSGMGVAPAGIDYPNTGHHHLIIDAPLPDFDGPLPADENHIHFGKGQTEVSLDLTPGVHTLQLVVGDRNHVPHIPPIASAQVTITVK